VIFHDVPGPGIFKKKIQDFSALSRRRGNPASSWVKRSRKFKTYYVLGDTINNARKLTVKRR